MIKIVKIGTKERIRLFVKHAIESGIDIGGFDGVVGGHGHYNYHDPTSDYYLFEPYFQWEYYKLADEGFLYREQLDSGHWLMEYVEFNRSAARAQMAATQNDAVF